MIEYLQYIPIVQEFISKFLKGESFEINENNITCVSKEGSCNGIIHKDNVSIYFNLELDYE